MRVTILSFSLLLSTLFFSCKDESKATTSTAVKDEPIEIAFMKEGELKLVKNDTIIKKLDIEIADTETSRQSGLMNRSKLGENQGMIFVFEQDNNTGFWMKDTRIPLDIIYINKDSIVQTVQKNAKPYDQTNLPANAPYRFVLEVNGGSSDQWGIQEGETKVIW